MMFGEKAIPRLIVFLPLVSIAVLTVVIAFFYTKQIYDYSEKQSMRIMAEFTAMKKKESEEWNDEIIRLFTYKVNHLEEQIKEELKARVEQAHDTASYIYDNYHTQSSNKKIKRHIRDALRRMVWDNEKDHVWITDYEGNNILSANPKLSGVNLYDYQDADGRAIILEEIQMVRKHGSGFLKSHFSSDSGEKILFVKDFDHYNWFLGGGMTVAYAKERVQLEMLKLIRSVQTGGSGFIAIYDNKGPVYMSEDAKQFLSTDAGRKLQNDLKPATQWHTIGENIAMVQSMHFAPFGWYILHGFDTRYMMKGIEDRQKLLEDKIAREVRLIIAVSVILGLVAALITLLFLRRINLIFNHYREEVKSREDLLKDFNGLLEERVRTEVKAHQDKEHMLFQQSKMAAMGDTISLIAHQWRQPLNQISHLFMNIEGAYEHNELNKVYLEKKIAEGTDLLEFMSHTIEDFRNYFMPDRERVETSIAEVVDHSASLIVKSLEVRGIEFETIHHSYSEVRIYRNALMQVLLNLTKNAKDVLVDRKRAEPKITVTTSENETHIIIEVCDNGGGVDEAIAEKIFDPYFTTKERNSGTGLGLTMSRNIVQDHLNGTLVLENRGEGACFIVTIAKIQSDASS